MENKKRSGGKFFLFAGISLVIIFVAFVVLNNQLNPIDDLDDAQDVDINDEYLAPQEVEIIGYSGDAMEPFISGDGKYLFFNSLNNGINTSLYYAERVSDIQFQFCGEVENVNQDIDPHLDAVASMDNLGNFFFISTRNYTNFYNTLYCGNFSNGSVSNVHVVPGNFFYEETGWIVMDAEISRDGQTLYVVNAKFTGPGVPTESNIRVARKVGNEFLIDSSATSKLSSINSNKLEYAPSSSIDGLTLLFTRLDGLNTTICMTTRNSTSDPFGIPQIFDLEGFVEAPSLTASDGGIYFHKKVDGIYHIFFLEHD